MTDRSLYLAAYDVSNERRRNASLALIKAYAAGGQRSFYEIFLTPAERGQLLHDLALVLDGPEDRFFLLRLDPRSRVYALGAAIAPADSTYFYFG